MTIYFVKCGEWVKIGYTTRRPDSRVDDFKTGNPFPLEIIYSCPGERHHETCLHSIFAGARARGEWFYAEPIECFLSSFDRSADLLDSARAYRDLMRDVCKSLFALAEWLAWPLGIPQPDVGWFDYDPSPSARMKQALSRAFNICQNNTMGPFKNPGTTAEGKRALARLRRHGLYADGGIKWGLAFPNNPASDRYRAMPDDVAELVRRKIALRTSPTSMREAFEKEENERRECEIERERAEVAARRAEAKRRPVPITWTQQLAIARSVWDPEMLQSELYDRYVAAGGVYSRKHIAGAVWARLNMDRKCAELTRAAIDVVERSLVA